MKHLLLVTLFAAFLLAGLVDRATGGTSYNPDEGGTPGHGFCQPWQWTHARWHNGHYDICGPYYGFPGVVVFIWRPL